jgi:membrane protease YdiL (CAAX protease family)
MRLSAPRLGGLARLAIAFEGGLLVLALGLGWLLDTPPLGQMDFGWAPLGWGAAATSLPIVALWWSARSRWEPFVNLEKSISEVLGPLFRDCSILEFALISALAGFGEEALFRGVLQTALTDATAPWLGLVVSSVLFGLAHLISPTYAVLAGIFGLYLGWLTMVQGNLVPAIAVHTLYDFVALIYLRAKHAEAAGAESPAVEPTPPRDVD